jgi:adenylosuccinate synthase
MPNAGHTYIDSKGQKMIHKVLPNGIVSPALQHVMIGPGAVFSLDRLDEEVRQAMEFGYLSGCELVIHPDAMVLRRHHTETEAAALSGISSTMQGSAAAIIEKMMRSGKASTALNVARGMFDIDSDEMTVPDWFGSALCTHEEWMEILENAQNVLAEGSQGWSLGINSGFYPYCTSRDCTPARFLSDMGIPLNMMKKVIGTARTYPIRVGNTPDGFSGGHYPDQEETSFEEIGVPGEFTTVTGRPRRVFTFSMEQIRQASFYCSPDEIFLNFANYLPNQEAVNAMVRDIEGATGTLVRYIGNGPAFGDVSDRWGNTCDK